MTNSVDVVTMIDDLVTAGAKITPKFKESVYKLYSTDTVESDSDDGGVLALINGIKRLF